ncbi:anti-sigma-28 factor FlgM [Oleiphilus messinensis]|uniref:Negative regulator of flagellin synthesis n=1 Tax=Oleiphilus messinensis TaxID=141451 RepID=A0A1Y0IAA2_9GAMM|nr:flagellar biosynthesis anti-sigma factor FlgM [Oleiphilus messinensis]ARU57452.1 anti-sigma-28 factor FlgM [Oleiphilus messinensis]
MVIDFNGVNPNQQAAQRARNETQAKDAAQSPASTPPAQANRGETVSVSNNAKSLQQLEESVKQLPDVDSEKVAKLKAAVEDGSYSVNADKLAQKMLEFESDTF